MYTYTPLTLASFVGVRGLTDTERFWSVVLAMIVFGSLLLITVTAPIWTPALSPTPIQCAIHIEAYHEWIMDWSHNRYGLMPAITETHVYGTLNLSMRHTELYTEHGESLDGGHYNIDAAPGTVIRSVYMTACGSRGCAQCQ